MVREQITTEDFQDGHNGSHHGFDSDGGNVENVKSLTDIRMSDGPWSTDHALADNLGFSAFVDIVTKWLNNSESPCRPNASHRGRHFGCPNGTTFAVLNLHVSPMPPTKFQLNPTYSFEADFNSRFSRWPQLWPSLILERKKISNSKSRA